jgi:hypothetical protein
VEAIFDFFKTTLGLTSGGVVIYILGWLTGPVVIGKLKSLLAAWGGGGSTK